MRGEHNERRHTGFYFLATVVLAVFVLRVAEAVLVPIAIAALLAFLLSPVVIRLHRWGLGRTWAVALTAGLAFFTIASIGYVITVQALELAQQLPKYESNIDTKIERLRASHHAPALAEVTNMMDRVQREMASSSTGPLVRDGRSPVAVTIESPSEGPWKIFSGLVVPAMAPVGTALIVIVFAVAILLQREDLRDRFLNVVSSSHLNLATQVVADASERVARYLGMQLMINTGYGVFIGLGLRLIGMPNALLWGLLAGFFRFIPYIGAWIAAACPIILSLAIAPGWWELSATFGLYLFAEFVTANIVEVMLFGASTGLSPLAVMISTVFWTWLWGPPGLFLATPITVCMLVLGKHVPSLAILNVLLGNRNALSPSAQFYHRMLAMDSEEMVDLALHYLEDHALADFYDEVYVPALIMSEDERHRGKLADIRERFIVSAGRELIEELERHRPMPPIGEGPHPLVLIIPAFDEADELVGRMLRHLLGEAGTLSEVITLNGAALEGVEKMGGTVIPVACVSALPPSALAPSRRMIRQIQGASPGIKVVAGVWAPEGNLEEIKPRLAHASPDMVATSLREARAQIAELLGAAGHPKLN
jgi:predicted PurR-regulated permease PerM